MIAFSGALICPHTIGKDIWVMNASDGSEKKNLTDDQETNDIRPAFSPDGKKILFESDRDSDKLEFYTISATDGSGLRRLTTNDTSEYDAEWAPARPACATSDGEPNPTLVGTAGDDRISGTPGADVICGLGGNDTINAAGGNDIVLGDGGDDTLVVSTSGKDTLNGGPGIDTASFARSSSAVRASLVSGFAQMVETNPLEGVALVGIEDLIGSAEGDTLSGSGASNELVGGGGADKIFGLAGGDTLTSRDGVNRNDTVDGGAGTDRCTTDAAEASVVNCP
jgi:Ca2+-binding RTX toxin-like protein